MMNRKSKMEMGVFLVVGGIFAFLGAAFLTIGVSVYCALKEEEGAILFSLIFGGMGLLFFAMGVVFIIMVWKRKHRNDRLLASGNYVTAQITEVAVNYSVNVNGRCPYVVHCQYQDGYGNVHLFRSRNLYFDPTDLLKDTMVKVYVDGENFNHYYVDIDAVLPNVTRH